jgi:hypothetical protein
LSDISHYTIPGVTTTTSNEIFSECIISDDSDSVHRFHTTAGGAYYAVGAGGPITGRGADLLLIDDPIKSREDASSAAFRRSLQGWYESVAYPRLEPGGAIVLIQTRWPLVEAWRKIRPDYSPTNLFTAAMSSMFAMGGSITLAERKAPAPSAAT